MSLPTDLITYADKEPATPGVAPLLNQEASAADFNQLKDGINGTAATVAAHTTALAAVGTRVQALEAAPPGAGNALVLYASKNGALGGANFETGACPANGNDTAALQALLDVTKNNPAGSVEIIIDRHCPVAGLKHYGNTTIRFTGSGSLVLLPGSNANVLESGNRVSGARLQNVRLYDMRLNGNGYANGRFQQAHHTATGWCCGYRGSHITGFVNTGAHYRNCRTLSYFVNDIEDFHIEGSVYEQSPDAPFGNLDGGKHVGPLKNGRVVRSFGFTQDDHESYCSNDGFWPTLAQRPAAATESQAGVDISATYGDVENVVVDQLCFNGNRGALRVLTTTQRIKSLTFRNVSGQIASGVVFVDNYEIGDTSQRAAFMYGDGSANNNGYVDKIVFDGFSVEGNTGYESTGFIALRATIKELVFNNLTCQNWTTPVSFIRIHPACVIDTLVFNNLRLERTDAAQVNFVESYGTVRDLYVNDAKYLRTNAPSAGAQAGANSSAVWRQMGGSTVRIHVNGMHTDRISGQIVWEGGTIGKIISRGVVMENDGYQLGHVDLGQHTLPGAVFSNFDAKTHAQGTIASMKGDAFGQAAAAPATTGTGTGSGSPGPVAATAKGPTSGNGLVFSNPLLVDFNDRGPNNLAFTSNGATFVTERTSPYYPGLSCSNSARAYAARPHSAYDDYTNGFTFAVPFQLAPDNSTTAIVFGKWHDPAGGVCLLYFQVTPGQPPGTTAGTLNLLSTNADGSNVSVSLNVALGLTKHVFVARWVKATGELKLRLDNGPDAVQGGKTTLIAGDTNPICLATDGRGDVTTCDAVFRDVVGYNRGLSDAETTTLVAQLG